MSQNFEKDIHEPIIKLANINDGFRDLYEDTLSNPDYENSAAYELNSDALKKLHQLRKKDEVNIKNSLDKIQDILGLLGNLHKILTQNGQSTAANIVGESMVLIIESANRHVENFRVRSCISKFPPQYKERINH